MSAALERLAKWRTLLTDWQLGRKEAEAIKDHREVSLMLRAETTALTRLLIEKGVVTLEEYERVLDEEADFLSKAHSRKFPGVKATDAGLHFDTAIAADTTRGWRD